MSASLLIVAPQHGLIRLDPSGVQQVLSMGGGRPPKGKPPKPPYNKPPGDERRRDRPEERLRRAPPRGHCCATEEDLVTPTGEQRTLVRRTNGAMPYNYYVQPVPFVRTANFQSEGDGCACTCCEYREQIKGSFLARFANRPTEPLRPWPPYLDFLEQPDQHGSTAVTPSETEWRDCSRPAPGQRGNAIRVGRRNDIQPRPGSNAFIEQDYDSPCSYWLDFYPQVEYVTGLYVKIDAMFRAAIVDVCNDERVVVGWREWSWKFEGQPFDHAH